MKTVKFSTLGCKVNQYETQSIREQFLRAGFKELENCSPADIYVINTCTVTHRADSESLNLIRRAKRENPKAKIIVTGCLIERDKEKVKQLSRNILILRNRGKGNILQLLAKNKLATCSLPLAIHSGITSFKGHTRAFLKIQDGCDNFCSYCIVPYVRGKPRSKKLEAVISEARALVNNGFREIVLTGICLGAYGKDLKPKSNIVKVIAELEKIKSLERIRLSSIEPQHVSDELIGKIASSQKLCPHLHIPLQSGDDEILKRMNRKYCSREYLKLIKKIKKRIPDIAVTTDVLAGFPGEEKAHFNNTLSLIKRIQPLKVHIFPYSRRDGTAACDLPRIKNSAEIIQRVNDLKKIADLCRINFRKRFLGKKVPVLIEGRVKGEKYQWQGTSANYIKVVLNSGRNDLKNKFVSPIITAIFPDCCEAKLASQP